MGLKLYFLRRDLTRGTRALCVGYIFSGVVMVLLCLRNLRCLDSRVYPTVEDIVVMNSGYTYDLLEHHRYIALPSPCTFPSPGSTLRSNVLIVVKSAVKNANIRTFIRQTWGSIQQQNVKVIFSLGQDLDSLRTKQLKDEIAQFRDIVQMDFRDSYKNNTLKLMMTFDFVVNHCPGANFILFIDDDVVINLDIFLKYQQTLNIDQDILEGFLLDRANVIRFWLSKWYVSCEDYPFVRWSPYVTGGCFLMSSSVVRKVHLSYPIVKYLNADDAWLGLVAKVAGVIPQNNPMFNHEGHEQSIVMESAHDIISLRETWATILKKKV